MLICMVNMYCSICMCVGFFKSVCCCCCMLRSLSHCRKVQSPETGKEKKCLAAPALPLRA